MSFNRAIYLDLDVIIDSRFGLLSITDKDLLIRVIENDYYFKRMYDEFEHVSNLAFRTIYKYRNKSILKNSIVTKIFDVLNRELLNIEKAKIHSNEVSIFNIDVNIYPYDLTENEKETIKKSILFHLFIDNVEINFICKNPINITLEECNSLYITMFKYDYVDWLNYSVITKNGEAPTTKLFVPALLYKPIKIKDIKSIENLFKSYSELHYMHIDITHIPVEYFSVKKENKDIILNKLRESN